MTPGSSASDDAVTLIAVGDVNLRNVTDPQAPFALVRETFQAADVVFGNCEGCFADPAVEIPYKPGWFHPDRATVAALAAGGFDVVGCANNVHYGAEAIRESLSWLDRHEIRHTGAGANAAEARAPATLERRRVRFGFLAYTSVFWPIGHAATERQPGVATVKATTAYQPHPRVLEMPGAPAIVITSPDPGELEAMCADIRRLREQVDVLVLSMHWGVSGSTGVQIYQQAVAHAAVEAGADLIVGHHPHVPCGIEFYQGKAIFYSLGNFVFGWERMSGRRDGLLVRAVVRSRRLAAVSFLPVWRDDRGQPSLVAPDSEQGRPIVEAVQALSAKFGTELQSGEAEVLVRREQ